MKEIKIYEIPNIDFIERIDDPYIGMIFYVADIDTYYSVKTLKEINGINMKGSKVVEYVIDEYADFGTGSGGGSGLTATQLSNIAKIPAIKSTVDALPNNYASKNHNHSEYASSSHRHDASEIDNLPSGGGTGLTTEQAQQLQTAYEHSQSRHVQASDIPDKVSELYNDSGFITNSALSNYVLTSEINGLVEDALAGTTVTSKHKVNYSSTAYNSEYKSIEVESGSAINIIFSIPEYTSRCNFYLSCSTNDISFGGSGYTNNGFSFTSASELSKTVTFTAASNITSKRYCYVYVAPYDETTNSTYDGYKIRFIISPSSDSSVTYGDIVVNNTTSSINEGQKFTYTVNLSKAPTNDQIVNITTTNSDVTVNPTSLTFTSSNYNVAQTVTVDVARDSDTTSDDCQITMASTGVTSQSFNIQINDIDTPSEKTLSSITAVYSQGATVVYPSTSLDSLKSNLVVTANYNDSTSETVTSYTLSGSLSVGTSTITVNYSGKTTTFNVNVTEEPSSGGDQGETVAADNLIFHIDGRDVEKGSSQTYWSNRITDASVTQYDIAGQTNMNTNWNDTSKTYGWLGDSYRYFVTGTKQETVTFSEITENYSICVGLLQEDVSSYYSDAIKRIFNISTGSGVGNRHYLKYENDGSLSIQFGNNASTGFVKDPSFNISTPETPAITHYYISVDFTNKVINLVVNGNKVASASIVIPVTNPRNVLQLVTGNYTVPVRLYYMRIYNTALTDSQMTELYNQENSVVRSVE